MLPWALAHLNNLGSISCVHNMKKPVYAEYQIKTIQLPALNAFYARDHRYLRQLKGEVQVKYPPITVHEGDLIYTYEHFSYLTKSQKWEHSKAEVFGRYF